MSNIKKLLIVAFMLFPGAVLADSDMSPIPEPTAETVLAVKLIPEKVDKLDLTSILSLSFVEQPKKEVQKVPVHKPAPESTIYEVKDGDTLYEVAETHKLSWQRIYDANIQVESPELIHPGDKLKIPKPEDDIASRPLPELPVVVEPAATQAVYNAPVQAVVLQAELIGSYGYALPGGNCVDMAKRYGKNQSGNPISWSPTTQTPFIGAAVLFYFNHVAVVTGIHSDGSVEVAHQNCTGCPSRYPRSMIRGFF